jgi:hypothetical protein
LFKFKTMSLSSDIRELSDNLRRLIDDIDSKVDKIKDLQSKLDRKIYDAENLEKNQKQ